MLPLKGTYGKSVALATQIRDEVVVVVTGQML
jgi:hypothetical protein